MICTVCGLQNPLNARFCGHCGAAQVSTATQPSALKYPLSMPDGSAVNDPHAINIAFLHTNLPFTKTQLLSGYVVVNWN
jgi:zinc-ribbon domain